MESIKKFDFIADKFSLNFEGKHQNSTFLGGILTLIGVLFSGLAIAAFGRDMFLKEHPQTNKDTIINLNGRQILKKDYFLFHLNYKSYDGNKYPMPDDWDRYYNVYLSQSDYDLAHLDIGETYSNNTYYEPVVCTEDRVKQEMQDLFLFDLKYYLCPPDNFPNEMEGTNGDMTHAFVGINVEICVNTTENGNKCYPDEYIREAFPEPRLMVYFEDYYLDGFDYESPGKSYVRSLNYVGSNYYFTHVIYFIKPVEYFTDIGWILEDYEQKNFLQTDYAETTSNPDPNTPKIFFFMFDLTKMKDVYKRYYLKIQGAIALIGGFIKGFYIFLTLFNSLISFPNIVEKFALKVLENNQKHHPKLLKEDENNLDKMKSFVSLFKNPVSSNVMALEQNSINSNFMNLSKVNNKLDFSNNLKKSTEVLRNTNIEGEVINPNNLVEKIKSNLLLKENINIKDNSICKLAIEYKRFSFCEKILRYLPCKSSSLIAKDKIYKIFLENYFKVISMENIIEVVSSFKLLERFKTLESLVLEEHQSHLLSYMNTPDYEFKLTLDNAVQKVVREQEIDKINKMLIKRLS